MTISATLRAAALFATIAGTASAATLELDSTGANAASGADLSYEISDGLGGWSSASIVTRTSGHSWTANDVDSKWIWVDADGQPADGSPNSTRDIRISFNLSGFNTTQASLAGRFQADDVLNSLSINGVDAGLSGGHWRSWTSFSEIGTGLFQNGLNTLVFSVSDTKRNIAGFRADALTVSDTAAAVPVPATLPLALAGLGGLALLRRRA